VDVVEHPAHRTALVSLGEVDLFDPLELDAGGIERRTAEELAHDAARVGDLLHGHDQQPVDRA